MEKKLPWIYISCNSGARIGLADELKPLIKVAWKNPDQPSLGFDYLYLDPEDYAILPNGTVACHEAQVDDHQTRMVIDHIVGAGNNIGVENLRVSLLAQ